MKKESQTSSANDTARKKAVKKKARPAMKAGKSVPANKKKAVAAPKDLFLMQDNDVPDLNTSTPYPVHPNRIWPD